VRERYTAFSSLDWHLNQTL